MIASTHTRERILELRQLVGHELRVRLNQRARETKDRYGLHESQVSLLRSEKSWRRFTLEWHMSLLLRMGYDVEITIRARRPE